MTETWKHTAGQRIKDHHGDPADCGATEQGREVLLNAERSVVGSMMFGADAIEAARAILTATDFYLVAHQRMFSSILALRDRGEPADILTVSEALRGRGELDLVGGPAALAAIFDNYGFTTANVKAHARIVLEAAHKRRLRRLGLAMQQWTADPTLSAADVLARVQDALARVAARLADPGAPGAAKEAGRGR